MTDHASAPPRSVRNFNPGNLERSATSWLGLAHIKEMSADQRAEERFCVFSEPKWGFRALALVLRAYESSHGLNTVRGILSRYAPKSENDTASYIKHVCNALACGADKALDLSDEKTLTALCKAIAVHEGGGWHFSDADLAQGVALARVKPVHSS